MAILNAVNLIDGLDGLAGGIGSIYFLPIGIIFMLTFALYKDNFTVAVILFGTVSTFSISSSFVRFMKKLKLFAVLNILSTDLYGIYSPGYTIPSIISISSA